MASAVAERSSRWPLHAPQPTGARAEHTALLGLLPECVAERYVAPGVRFVPLAGEPAAFATAVVTRRDSAHMPTAAFLRAVANAENRLASVPSAAPVVAVA